MIPHCVPSGNPKALEFLRMDCTNVLSFFGKLGVTVPSIRHMFDFVVNPDITPARVDERFAAVRPVVLSLFALPSPLPPSLPPSISLTSSQCLHAFAVVICARSCPRACDIDWHDHVARLPPTLCLQLIEEARTAPPESAEDEVDTAVFMNMFIPKTLSEVSTGGRCLRSGWW